LILSHLQVAIPAENIYGYLARKFHNLGVGSEVSDVEFEGITTLLSAVDITCTS
jgi:hypothetical protein